MKLIVLCVDGFDYDHARELGRDPLPHSARLTIPRECYTETLDGPQPATGKVWASILSGRIYDQAATVRVGARKMIHDWFMKAGITWSGPPKYTVNPWNRGIETVLRGRNAFAWNLPTICPEWIARFPDLPHIVDFAEREYQMFRMIAHGLISAPHSFELAMIYTRTLDVWGHVTHVKSPQDIEKMYLEISSEAGRLSMELLAKGCHTMMISDHGILNGRHTDHAYIGATFPFEAESILDVRSVIERALMPRCLREGPCFFKENERNCSLDFGTPCPREEVRQ